MDDKNGNGKISYTGSDKYTDIKAFSDNANAPVRKPKEKFVVHIDDGFDDNLDDSLLFDFAAFSSPSDREKEQRRREESRQKFSQLNFSEGITPVKSQARQQASSNQTAPKKAPLDVPKRSEFMGGASKQENKKVSVPINNPLSQYRKKKTENEEAKAKAKAEAEARAEAEAKAKASAPVQKATEVQDEGKNETKLESELKRVVRMKTRSPVGFFTGLTGFIVISVIVTVILTSVGLSTIGDILAYNRNETSVTVVIENEKDGSSPSFNSVIDALHDAGLIKQKLLCTVFAKYRNFDGYKDKEGKWHDIEYLSGVYYLEPKLGLEGMLNTIKVSNTASTDTVRLTFPEGWSITQIFERLEKNGVCEAGKLYANLETVAKQYDFYYDITITDVRYLGLEGYLFPDTYEFFKNENAVSVLRKLFENSNVKWTAEFDAKAKSLGYSRDQILNIAAIIQREAANKSQMASVSSVIHNRLNSSTYPLLQCNSTLDYITNYVKGHVEPSYAQMYADAYNTYKVEGLPPGPICNPGLDAIEAALNPKETDYYFFVHNNDGKIYLSSTYSQFQRDCLQVIKDNSK